MQIGLRSVPARIAFLLVCFSALAGYGFSAVRKYRAFHFSNSSQYDRLLLASRLEPNNAEYQYLLGNYLYLVGDDVNAAIAHYQSALAINPWVSRYWLDLSRALFAADNSDGQQRAVEQALRIDPTTPATIWTAANLFLAQGDEIRGLELLRRVMLNDPGSMDDALSLCWRVTTDGPTILEHALPRSPASYAKFLDFAIGRDDLPAATAAWNHLLDLHQAFPQSAGIHYVSFLISRQQPEQADIAWKTLAALNPALKEYTTSNNLVANGGFENEMLNGGWDWWYAAGVPGIWLNIDTNESHSGSRSLRIQVDGEASDAGIRHYALVKPGTTYEFSAAYRAAPLEGAHGFSFAWFDVDREELLASTEESDTLGLTPWRVAHAQFKTGPDTRLIVLLLNHPGGLVRGTLWVDDVQLAEK